MYRLSEMPANVEWTPALGDNGAPLDDSSWGTSESQTTFTIDVPFFRTGDIKRSMLDKRAISQDAYEQSGYNLHRAIAYTLGFPKYRGEGQNLDRACPVRHPIFHHLRAFHVDVKPKGEEFRRIQSPLGRITGKNLSIVIFNMYRLTILFRSLKYEALDNAEISEPGERDRYVTEEVQGRSEFITREGGQFFFVAGTPPAGTPFAQPLGMLLGAYDLVLTWHQLPREAIFNGLYPTKIVELLGCVNKDEVESKFVQPGAKLGLANGASTYKYSPGIMLFSGVEIFPEEAPVVPQLMGLQNIFFTPRTYTVKYHFGINPRGWNLCPAPSNGPGGDLFWLVTHNGLAPPDGRTLYRPANLLGNLFRPGTALPLLP